MCFIELSHPILPSYRSSSRSSLCFLLANNLPMRWIHSSGQSIIGVGVYKPRASRLLNCRTSTTISEKWRRLTACHQQHQHQKFLLVVPQKSMTGTRNTTTTLHQGEGMATLLVHSIKSLNHLRNTIWDAPWKRTTTIPSTALRFHVTCTNMIARMATLIVFRQFLQHAVETIRQYTKWLTVARMTKNHP